MPQLKDKVGRFAATGRSCQNWKQDQELVISLLNKIAISDGGAETTLKPQMVVTGHASDSLYNSILYFQKKNFPGTPDGYIRPGGPTFTRLVDLAAKAAAKPPPPKGQWDAIATPSVDAALRKGLLDDSKLDYAEVVDIIRATVADGMVTAFELDDLTTIANTSRTLSPTSKKLITLFVGDEKKKWLGVGPYDLNSDQKKLAAEMVCDFLKNTRTTFFPKLDPHRVGIGILRRIAKPSLIDQDQASMCGPSALMFSYASDKPGQYARFAIDLYQKGQANLGRLLIKPGKDVKNYTPPYSLDHVDWLTCASIRDSENWFLDFDDTGRISDVAGITLPSEMEQWFRKAGYQDVREETNLKFSKGLDSVNEANALLAGGYRVCLFISANMIEYDDQSDEGSVLTRHWVVLRDRIQVSSGNVTTTIFTWGKGDYAIPHPGKGGAQKPLSIGDFLMNYYGYVAAKA
ncbi:MULTISPECIES: hypothetical protein [Bradyrhizobium]|uniref:Uncharacterized protein n=1 Tax=Bradyrhizobium elkanii TaxID=29448 RepID=A0A4U6RXQ4_BRAEL|nr:MULTISPECIES: hypothetical protein [Bradyrhizobium]MTV12274.1 hypothetical protein [Bradyrhizobium sp. BR2003]TKV79540.1 hypothetical protein FDV58_20400 [Bradyrhizobium elkanii]